VLFGTAEAVPYKELAVATQAIRLHSFNQFYENGLSGRGKEFHCVRGKIMFPCKNPGVGWEDSGRRAGAEHESYRCEAATRHEEILEIDARLPAEA